MCNADWTWYHIYQEIECEDLVEPVRRAPGQAETEEEVYIYIYIYIYMFVYAYT